MRVSEHMTVASIMVGDEDDDDEGQGQGGGAGHAGWRGDEAALEHSWALLHEREERLG